MLSVLCFHASLCGLLVLSSFLQEAASCPKGWLSYLNNCYGVIPDKLGGSEAEEECQSFGQGGHLASIHTDAELEVVAHYVSLGFKGVGNVWIGLVDNWRLRKWSWKDGTKAQNVYWAAGAPKFFTNSRFCAYMIESEGYKKWLDASCSEKYAFLCKVKQ